MIGSLLDLVRFLERLGIVHVVRAGTIEIATEEGKLALAWDRARGRVYAVRWDDDEVRAALRLSMPLSGDGTIAEAAVARLISAAMPRGQRMMLLSQA